MKVHIGPYPDTDEYERKIDITIDHYDIWNLDHTLALIIHPCLVKLKNERHGTCHIDDEDVPESLRRTEAEYIAQQHHGEVDPKWELRWDYVIDLMIDTFDRIINHEAINYTDEKIKEGLRLFAKYYFALWD